MAYTRARPASHWLDYPDTTYGTVGSAEFGKWDTALDQLKGNWRDLRDYGAVGDGVNDDAAALTAALPSANSTGATIVVPPGTWTWGSVPALPKGITGRLKVMALPGAVVKLTTAGPRFLDFNKTADHDLFQNIEIGDLTIDCNNVAGTNANHVVIGTRRGATGALTRINLDNIYIHDIRVVNVPTATGNVRIAVYLSVQQASGGEGTQNYGKNILVERVRAYGGEGGVYVDGGTNATFPDVNSNVLLDNITIADCYHTTNSVPSAFRANANFLIGGSVYGGTCAIRGCVGELSGDVSIEVDSMTEAFVTNCDMHDAGFYYTNYHQPLYPSQQRIVLRDNTVRLTNNSVRPSENIIPYRLKKDATAAIDLGAIEIHGCDWYRSLTDAPVGIRGIWINGPCARITITDYTAVATGIAYSSSSASDLYAVYLDNCSGTGSTDIPVTLRNIRGSFAGARSGTGVLSSGLIVFANNTKASPLTLDGLWMNLALTGMSSASVRGVNIGASGSAVKVNGELRRIHVLNLSDDTGAAAVRFGAQTTAVTTPNRVDIDDCDFTALTSGQTEILFSTNNNLKPFVYATGIRWRAYPKASSAVDANSFAAATFTTATGNQYINLVAAEIHFATGTGSGVTKIEASKDGTTYEQVYAQASGAMAQDVLVPVDNGDYIRITFTGTQPTVRVRPRK
jgi:hypothetical protein